MFLSDRDLQYAIECGRLIVSSTDGQLPKIDSTSIDLRLDGPTQAKVWDLARFNGDMNLTGSRQNELRVASVPDFEVFSTKYTKPVPFENDAGPSDLVFRRGDDVIVKPQGFLLWQTKEKVGTPDDGDLISIINGKSTRARTGLLVHFTAPTIHTTWQGNVTLEIANLGPFHLVLHEDDRIAQITVAKITSTPVTKAKVSMQTFGQAAPTAAKGSQPGS